MIKTAIIGGGATGYCLAKELSRRGISVDLFERECLGGQLSRGYPWQRLNTPNDVIKFQDIPLPRAGYSRLSCFTSKLSQSLESDSLVRIYKLNIDKIFCRKEGAELQSHQSVIGPYDTVFVAIGREDRKRVPLVSSNNILLDPYRDTHRVAGGSAIVLGSGSTAVDCAIELCNRGKSVDLVVEKRINYLPRQPPTCLSNFAIRNLQLRAVRILSSYTLMFAKTIFKSRIPLQFWR